MQSSMNGLPPSAIDFGWVHLLDARLPQSAQALATVHPFLDASSRRSGRESQPRGTSLDARCPWQPLVPPNLDELLPGLVSQGLVPGIRIPYPLRPRARTRHVSLYHRPLLPGFSVAYSASRRLSYPGLLLFLGRPFPFDTISGIRGDGFEHLSRTSISLTTYHG